MFRDDSSHTFNPRLKFFVHNKGEGEFVFKQVSSFSLALGPDLQGHLGAKESAVSGGLAMRMLFTDFNVGPGFVFGELSLRGGGGKLHPEGPFQFVAADLSVSSLGFYVGAGFRKEFWPNSSADHFYPTFSAGFGLF